TQLFDALEKGLATLLGQHLAHQRSQLAHVVSQGRVMRLKRNVAQVIGMPVCRAHPFLLISCAGSIIRGTSLTADKAANDGQRRSRLDDATRVRTPRFAPASFTPPFIPSSPTSDTI